VLHIKTELGNRKISEPGQESPDLTNERKIMSTKTLRKRIALVAVSAMGFGLLTTVSASAALSDVDPDTYDYTATGSIGVCTDPVNTAAASAGTAHSAANNLTQGTGEVLVGGTLQFTKAVNDQIATAGDQVTISVVNGTLSLGSSVVPLNPTWGAGLTSLTQTNTSGSASTLASGFTVKAPSTPGSMQVKISKNASGAAATTVEIYTILVSTACTTGAADLTNSLIKVTYENNKTATAITDNITETYTASGTAAGANVKFGESADKIANAGTAYVAFRIKDGTSSANAVTAGPGTFSASATNGANIGWGAVASPDQSSAVTTVANGSAQAQTLYVTQGTANKDKPLTTVVTLSYNGVVYGTRTITFTGKAAKIAISAADSVIGKKGVTAKAVIAYEITDAAGNKLTSAGPGVTGASGETNNGAANTPLLATSGVVVDANQNVITSVSTVNTEASGYAGTADVACGASGSTKVYLKYRFSDLSTIQSDPVAISCGGAPANYKAALDKTSYAPGEIATLTITATDSSGNAVYDNDDTALTTGPAGNAVGSTAQPVSISLPQMTAVVTPTNSDTFSGGVKKYKFTVGTTEGSFSGVVDLPLYDGTTYSQTAQTVSYKVAAGSASVTNAEVLAAIVKLIASINKQIAALQKALTKKK